MFLKGWTGRKDLSVLKGGYREFLRLYSYW